MTTDARVTQFGTQILRQGLADVRVTQFGTQILRQGLADVRVTQFGVQVLCNVPRTKIVQPIVFVT